MMKAKIKTNQKNQQPKTHSAHQSSVTTFSDHVTELRRRGLWIGLLFILFSALAYNYHDVLLKVIMAPLEGQKLVYLTPGGGFSFIFLICMYAGLLASIPAFIYHLHAFIKPALPHRAQQSTFRIILSAGLLTLGGILYGYFIAIPAALHFLMNFAGDAVSPNLTAESYLNFFLAYIAGLAVLFLLPLVLMFIHWIKPLKPSGLFKSERWVILFAFIAAALITPTPDVVNQLMIALPVIGIYQIGVVSILISIFFKKRDDKQTHNNHQTEAIPEDIIASMVSPEKSFSDADEVNETVAAPDPVEPPVPSPNLIQSQPARRERVTRSVDGFRSPTKSLVSSRPDRQRQYPVSRSIDGMISRRPQSTQN